MKNENIINITGYVYNFKKSMFQNGTVLHTFGLQFYCGKKDGKNIYNFIDVKIFGEFPIIEDKTQVLVTGRLYVGSYMDRGVKKYRTYIIAESVKQDVTSKEKSQEKELKGQDVPDNFDFDDSIDF